VRFAFTEEQVLFARTVREALAGDAADRWAQLGELGLLGLTLGEAHGGLGLDETDLVLALEETGYACLPEPVLEHYVGGSALRDAGRDDLLDGVAAGERRVSAGGALVSHADGADLLVLESAGAVHAVPAKEVTLRPERSIDPSRRLSSVAWTPGEDNRLGDAGALERLTDRAAFAAAAQLAGAGRRLVEMGAAYAVDRRQFGVPVGSFQAVKHLLAGAHLAVEFARPVVYRAAWSLARDEPTRGRDASMAKAMASEAATVAARAALQVHGAIGYTEEHELHRWLKRAFALAGAWGDASRHRERVKDALLGAP
jgi:alkylation response protein AidB-like acyl-CoA dehydrogenase